MLKKKAKKYDWLMELGVEKKRLEAAVESFEEQFWIQFSEHLWQTAKQDPSCLTYSMAFYFSYLKDKKAIFNILNELLLLAVLWQTYGWKWQSWWSIGGMAAIFFGIDKLRDGLVTLVAFFVLFVAVFNIFVAIVDVMTHWNPFQIPVAFAVLFTLFRHAVHQRGYMMIDKLVS
jgi:hypothetical protein